MTAKEMKRWSRAATLARLVMGKSEARRNSPSYWLADEDPLAWWCLTEAIYET